MDANGGFRAKVGRDGTARYAGEASANWRFPST